MRRFFRLWYVRWIALPLLLVVAAHAGAVLVMAARFESRLDALRHPGLPLELEEFAAPPVAEEDNAAPLLAEAEAWHAEHLAESVPNILDMDLPEDEWDPEEREQVRAWLRSGDPYVDLLARAAARPHLRQDLDWSKGPGMVVLTIPHVQSATRFLEERVRRAERATPQQLRELAILLALARKVERTFAITILVRWTVEEVAVDALTPLSKRPGFDPRAARAILDAPLAKTLDHTALLRDALRGERATAIFVLRRWLDGAGPLDVLELTEEPSRLSFNSLSATWIGRPVVYRGAMRTLDMFDRMHDLLDAPPVEAWRASQEVADDYQSAFDGVAGFWRNVPVRLFHDRLRHTAKIRIARVGLALLQRREETGSWPKDLDATIPLVDSEMLTDPFTNARLQYEPGVRLEAAVPIPPGMQDGDYPEIEKELREDNRIVWKFK